jgi:hypothetical protein
LFKGLARSKPNPIESFVVAAAIAGIETGPAGKQQQGQIFSNNIRRQT